MMMPTNRVTIDVASLMAGEGRWPPRENDRRAQPAAARPTVLVIDEPGAQFSRVSEILQHDGCDVLVAASSRDAADLLRARALDCVVAAPHTATALHDDIVAARTALFVILPLGDDTLAAEVLDAGADDCATLSSGLDLITVRLRALLRRTHAERTRATALIDAIAHTENELVSLNYAISHDLRAPLRAIDGLGRILLEECGSTLDAKHLGYVQRIGAAARELGVLIDDLLQLSRVGRADLRPGRVDLSELAHRVASDLQASSATRAVEVVIEDGLVAHGDRSLMRLAVEHLLGNSWKFTSRTPSPRIEFRAERIDGGTGFIVRDNGAGFDPTRADRLFQPFQRLHTAAEFEGAGIGLAVVYKIVDRHGGRVWAEGQPGLGASIYFTLPAAPGGRDR
jgi:signal transduction histidine kinase